VYVFWVFIICCDEDIEDIVGRLPLDMDIEEWKGGSWFIS